MLSDKQLKAIDELIMGKKRVQIEASVDISHVQLYRWTHEDDEFIRRWRLERARTHERRMDKFFAEVDHALDVIGESLDEGDPKAAMDLLKLAGPGLTDVNWIDADPNTQAAIEPAPLAAGSNLYECEACSRTFKSAGALGSHRRVHAT